MERTNRGGSILGFIFVAIGLALVLLGSLYFVHQQSVARQSSTPQASPVAVSQPRQQPQETPVTQPRSSQQATDTAKKPQPAVSQSSSSTTQATSHPSAVAALPHTGPIETFDVIGAGLLSWSLIAYVRSRRARFPVLT